jgi:PPP family 3-phenylpropionic acid transporter
MNDPVADKAINLQSGNEHTGAVPPLRLWPIKIIYFLLFAAQGVYFTFINVYFAGIGLSGTQIGLINTVSPLVGMFSSPGWGLLSDRSGKTRRLLAIATLGVIVTSLAIGQVRSFTLLLVIVALYALFNSPVIPLVDSTNLELLGEHRERYGAQRVWGSIGFVITSAAIGLIVERAGIHFIFTGNAVILAGFIVALVALPERPVRLGTSIWRGLNTMVRRPPWVVFALSIGLLGMANSGMLNFLSVTLRQMGGSDSLIGITWTISAVAEMPIMILSAVLLKRFGARRLISIAIFVYGLRLVLYSVMPAPEWAAWISLLGGLSFGLYWISSVTYASELAPDHLKATSQGLLVAVTSLAGIIGATLAGWLFDQVGPFMMFRILAGFCVLALILLIVSQLLMTRRHAA